MSTIKVDTYLTRGGASEIAIDKLKGASSASSISIVGEGGTNTINLQGGLTKAWADGTASAGLDNSFNISGGTYNGTGDYSYALSITLANANIVGAGSATDNADRNVTLHSPTTSSYRIEIYETNGSDADVSNKSMICGDLA